MKKNPIKVITTHIHTLSHNTPKSRRRIRKILGLDKGAPVTPDNVAVAVSKAISAEVRHNAPSDKKRR